MRLLPLFLAAMTAVAPIGVQARPVVLELFTSQGCSSCPPADAVLAGLARRPGIIALSTPVDYWDNLGWKDSFARPENTAKQYGYGRRLGLSGVYTPQLVVNGVAETVGSRAPFVEALVDQAARQPAPVAVALSRQADGGLTVDLSGVSKTPAHVELLWVKSEGVAAVRRGENGGRTLHYSNVVIAALPVGEWTGATERLSVPAAVAGRHSADRLVVLVQVPRQGPILGADMIALN